MTKDALSSVTPSLAPGAGSPLLSESFGAAFIPERKFSGSPASNSPIADTDPCRLSREDQHDREAWMPAISQVGTNRYRDNEVEAIIPYGHQSSCQLSHQPRPKPRSHPVPESYFSERPIPAGSLSRPSPVYASTNYSSSPPLQAAPRHRSRAGNAEERPEKKYWCSELGCRRGYTQPQGLGRHVKDVHETKDLCTHCLSQGLSVPFSRGRPYLYRNHLKTQHREIALPEVRYKGSRYARESLNMGARQAQNATRNYVPPLTRAVPSQDMSFYPCAKFN